MCKLLAMKISEFLTDKFLEWQKQERERKTVEQFAKHLGVSQPLVSLWMSGKRPVKGLQHKKRLIELYGDEVAKILGEDPQLFFINEHWHDANEDLQRAVYRLLQKGISKNDVKRVAKRREKTSN